MVLSDIQSESLTSMASVISILNLSSWSASTRERLILNTLFIHSETDEKKLSAALVTYPPSGVIQSSTSTTAAAATTRLVIILRLASRCFFAFSRCFIPAMVAAFSSSDTGSSRITKRNVTCSSSRWECSLSNKVGFV